MQCEGRIHTRSITMLGTTLAKIFGSKNDRMIKRYRQMVARINDLEETVAPLDDAELAAGAARAAAGSARNSRAVGKNSLRWAYLIGEKASFSR